VKRASITEAKNGLSALLDRVRHGETVLIEDRGRAVAQLTPVSRTEPGLDADRLAELERRGIVRPARSPKPAASVLSKPPRPRRAQALSQSVIDERARGW
jgi:prevent-host-death family protein